MATVITSECINCGACEPECPNTAIYQGGVEWEHNGAMNPAIAQDIFYIVPEKCTECVGFHDHEACAAVCPVDCCVPDPKIPETEDVLIARAKTLHPEQEFPADFPSRFRKEGAAAPPTAPAAPPAAAAAPAAAPAPTPAAAPPTPAAAKPAAKPAAAPGRVEKPLAAPKPAPARPMVEKTFPGELPGTFEGTLAQLSAIRPGASKALKWLTALGQPLLGALPFSQKKTIEEAVGDPRFFTASGATGVNVLHNMILYPAILAAVGALTLDKQVFSNQLYGLISLGFGLGALEAVMRLREGVLHAMPMDRVTYRAAWYAPPLAALFAPFTRSLRRVAQQGSIPVDGFQGGSFEDKIERERRYGEVYSLQEKGNGYLLRVEFPRRVPDSALKDELGIPDDMPDYDYELSLRNGYFVVKGSVVDDNLRKLAAVSPAFPPDFTTNVELPAPVKGFKHRVHDKTLEVVLLKR
ncbi:MAG TPA: 4Fe-4S dicluster domain-containing protein [Candidatus Acidoferrales bacterium]|nr:4Fe-4S dicluster domain-containing protein [Candidatus Acidoferrales bacterium]